MPNKYEKIEKKIITIPKRILEQETNETFAFAWDNEFPKHKIIVKEFKVYNLPITWAEINDLIQENINIIRRYDSNNRLNGNFSLNVDVDCDENKENININEIS